MNEINELADRIAVVRSATANMRPVAQSALADTASTVAVALVAAGMEYELAARLADRWTAAINRLAVTSAVAHEAAVAAETVVLEITEMSRNGNQVRPDERNRNGTGDSA